MNECPLFLVFLATLVAGPLVYAGSNKVMPKKKLDHTRQLIAAHKPVRVVLYGDSISEVKEGWSGGASAPDNNWGAVLVQKLNEAHPDSEFSIRHFAIGGQNTYEGLGRLRYLKKHQPDLVLVAFGANDCNHHEISPEATKRALTELIGETEERFGADVVVVSTGGDNPQKPFFQHLEETVQAQREAASETDVPFVNVRTAMLKATDDGDNWGEYHLNPGNCHPNDAGHEVWAKTVFEALQRIFAQDRTKNADPK